MLPPASALSTGRLRLVTLLKHRVQGALVRSPLAAKNSAMVPHKVSNRITKLTEMKQDDGLYYVDWRDGVSPYCVALV